MVLVSLSGVMLLPSLNQSLLLESTLDLRQEQVADEALHTFLVSQSDLFSYRVAGDLVDTVAQGIGINVSSEGLYRSITQGILAREQLHKTYAALIAENLGCQFRLPFDLLNISRFNFLTSEFDQSLHRETEHFFTFFLGNKYQYYFTAQWYPIKGIRFGGEFKSGILPQTTDCFIAQRTIVMPYTPAITIGSTSFIFTKHWLNHHLFTSSTIPSFENISLILSEYKLNNPPFDSRSYATTQLRTNISELTYGFLVNGVTSTDNVTLFPGIVNLTITYGFSQLRSALEKFTTQACQLVLGEGLAGINALFSDLGTESSNPIFDELTRQVKETLQSYLNITIHSCTEGFIALEHSIKQTAVTLLGSFLAPYIDSFVEDLLEIIDIDYVLDLSALLSDWLFERVALNKAKVQLTIWEKRG
jgi:hypothetical protein